MGDVSKDGLLKKLDGDYMHNRSGRCMIHPYKIQITPIEKVIAYRLK